MPTLKRWSSYLFIFKHWKWTSLNIYTSKSSGAFQFSCALVASQQRNHRKSFYHHGKYFAKENFCMDFGEMLLTVKSQKIFFPSWKIFCGRKLLHGLWRNVITGTKLGILSRLYRSILPVQIANQCGIWFILPTHGANAI